MKSGRYVPLLVLAFVALAAVSLGALGFFRVEDGAVSFRVTERGVVQEIVSDCAPDQNKTCTFFHIYVLRADDGKTYLLTNFPKAVANEWKNKTASIVGYLSTPSNSGFSFVDGDLYVESVTAG